MQVFVKFPLTNPGALLYLAFVVNEKLKALETILNNPKECAQVLGYSDRHYTDLSSGKAPLQKHVILAIERLLDVARKAILDLP